MPGTLPAVELWRSMLASVPELGFADLARLLANRPEPAAHVKQAMADKARDRQSVDPVPVWPRALIESVVAAERLVAHLQARIAADLADLAGNYPGLRENLSTELALVLGCSEASAGRRLDEAEETSRRLPATVSARWRGSLSQQKVTALRSETANVPDEVAALVEVDVLPAASRQTVPELRAAIRRSILRWDAAGAETRHRSALARRRVSRWSLPEGMAGLTVISSATDIAAIDECLSAVADLAKTPGDGRIRDQRRVDALVDVCTDILESGQFAGKPLPKSHRRRPQVQVTMPLDAVLGSDSACELKGYGPITADQARQIAADGEFRRLVCDPLSGTLLDYGRTVYEPPQALKEHIIARDKRCTAPGCRRSAVSCEIDHTVPYPRGKTAAHNLAALCKHHHRCKDGGGFSVRRHADGWSTWTTPMGYTVTTPPSRLWYPRPYDFVEPRPAMQGGILAAAVRGAQADHAIGADEGTADERPVDERTAGERTDVDSTTADENPPASCREFPSDRGPRDGYRDDTPPF